MCVWESSPLTEQPTGSFQMFRQRASAGGMASCFAVFTASSTSFFTACSKSQQHKSVTWWLLAELQLDSG